MEFIKDLYLFLKTRKKYWLIPLVVILFLLATLLVVTSATALGPLIYTLF